jgi:O-antigen/teichoic acid export membrane protein
MHLRYQLFRNSSTKLIQIVVTTAVGLVLPPVLLARLGLEVYGIWALIILVNSYVFLLDLGFQSGLAKLVAEAEARQETDRVQCLVNVSLAVYVVVLALGCLLTWAAGPILAKWLLNSLPDPAPYTRVFQVYAIVSLSGLLAIPFSGLLSGRQRYDQTNFVETVAMLLNAVASLILVLAGRGLWGMLAGAGVAALWRLVTYVWLAFRAFPSLRLGRVSPGGLDTLRQLIYLSPADESVRIYNVVTQSLVRLAISTYAGVTFVGLYDIAKRVVSQVSGLSTIVFFPLVPAISSLAAQGRRDSLHELLRRCWLYLSMIGLPLATFFLIFYDPLLRAWLGLADVSAISLAGRLLLVATLAEIFTGPATTAAVGLGTPLLQVLKVVLTGILYALLVLGLAPRFAFAGALAGETAALLLGSVIGLALFQAWFHIPVGGMILGAIKRVGLVTLPVWLLLLGVWLAFRNLALWQGLFAWGVMLVVGLAGTGLGYWATGLLSSYEVDLARNALAVKLRRAP